jgi:hypothetical protein
MRMVVAPPVSQQDKPREVGDLQIIQIALLTGLSRRKQTN